MTDLSSLGVKQLKMVISQAGLSFADCSEKAELVRRAGEAQTLLNSQEDSDDDDDDDNGAQERIEEKLGAIDGMFSSAEDPNELMAMLEQVEAMCQNHRFQVCVIDTVARAVDAGTLAEHDAAELNENLSVQSHALHHDKQSGLKELGGRTTRFALGEQGTDECVIVEIECIFEEDEDGWTEDWWIGFGAEGAEELTELVTGSRSDEGCEVSEDATAWPQFQECIADLGIRASKSSLGKGMLRGLVLAGWAETQEMRGCSWSHFLDDGDDNAASLYKFSDAVVANFPDEQVSPKKFVSKRGGKSRR